MSRADDVRREIEALPYPQKYVQVGCEDRVREWHAGRNAAADIAVRHVRELEAKLDRELSEALALNNEMKELHEAACDERDCLREACEAAKRELNCLIGQATQRGMTSGGPKRVVEQLEAALRQEGAKP